MACARSAIVAIFYAGTGATFTRVIEPNGSGPTWSGIAAADLDSDGADDVVPNGPEAVVRIFFGHTSHERR